MSEQQQAHLDLARTEASLSRRAELLKYVFIIITFLTVMVTLVLVSFQLHQVQVLVETNQELSRGNQQLSETLLDCTQPTGKCFERGQARTGAAVGTINEITILAAYCAKLPENDTEGEIRACIEKELGD